MDSFVEDGEPAAWVDAIAREVVDAALAVHREMGPGLLERVYRDALAVELTLRGQVVEREVGVPLSYRGHPLGAEMRLDLRAGGAVVVEAKSVRRLEDVHASQILTYLRHTGCPVGLLINFDPPRLRDGIRRVVLTRPRP